MLRELIGKHKSELPTPCLLLDIDAAARNIEKMAAYFSQLECELRPHAKTHKLPWIAHRQIGAGAIGITCAKLEDAKEFIEAGIENILIANQVVGEPKIEQLVNLSCLANIIVCIDNLNNAQQLSALAKRRGIRLPILVEVDVGINRCGLSPGKSILKFVQEVTKLKGLSFEGLMGYEGGLFKISQNEKERICKQRNLALISTKELLEKKGLPVNVVSAGGSNTYQISGLCPGITDIQPGSYVTMDDWNARHGIDFEQAVTVLSTIISRPARERAVIDVGVKAISVDHGFPRVISHDGVKIQALNEEHGKLLLTDPIPEIVVGETVELVPSHGCTTIPQYHRYLAIKDGYCVADMRIVSGAAAY